MKFCKTCEKEIGRIELDFVRGLWDADVRDDGRVYVGAGSGPADWRFAVLCNEDSINLKKELNKIFGIKVK